MRGRGFIAALVYSVALCGCVVDALSFVGRPCSDDDPCGGGLSCRQGRCAADDGGAVDVGSDGDASVDTVPPDARVVPPPPPGTHVSLDGWGQRNPTPLGVRFHDIWYDAKSGQVWVVGELGLAARYDVNTKRWSTYHTGTREALHAVWADDGANIVRAVGAEGAIVELDKPADAWRFSYTAPGGLALHDVVGVGDDVYIAAADGSIVQLVSGTWSVQAVAGGPLPYRAITTTNGAVVAVGDGGSVAVKSGTKWSVANVTGGPDFIDLTSEGMTVHALARLKGNVYSAPIPAQPTASDVAADLAANPRSYIAAALVSAAVRVTDDVWLASGGVVWHYDGGKVLRVSIAEDLTTHRLERIVLSPTGAWACGGAGYVYELDPTIGTLRSQGTRDSLRAVDVGKGGGIVAVSAEGNVLIGTQHAAATTALHGVWAGAGDAWVVGSGRTKIGRFTGNDVTQVTSFSPAAGPQVLRAVSGAGARVWAVGDGVWSRDPATGVWTREAVDPLSGDTWRAVHAVSETDVWVVGAQGQVTHYDGSEWKAVPGTQVPLTGVWAAGDGTVWVVGDNGYLARRDGTAWARVHLTDAALHAIDGVSGSRLWAVGDGGTILSFNGGSWRVDQSDTTQALRGVAVGGADDVTVVGDGGTILHFDDRPRP